MDIRFTTFRELKAALEQIPGHLLDKEVQLCNETGQPVVGGTVTMQAGAVFILEGE
jgi:hypothetical protein